MRLRLSERQLHQQIRYFAYYELFSGIAAALLIVGLLAQVTSLSGLALLLYAGALGLASFTIYCGYLTWKRPLRGLRYSRLSLLTQFLGFAAGGFSFRFFAGPYVALSLDFTQDVLFKADFFLTDVSLKINSDADALFISVNVVALLLLLRTTVWLNEWQARYAGAPANPIE